MGWLRREPRKLMGRPMKYADLLEKLEKRNLFTAASIAGIARDSGYIDPELSPEEFQRTVQRIRITLGRLTKNRGFPSEGDGWVRLPKQAAVPAWFGWRWRITTRGTRHKSGYVN